jgi:predicted ABC-type transport system involved in lysophospholipase L1 biosynthesis ATPase subunit
MRPAAAVEFVDVVKRFGAGSTEVRALSGVSLRVEPGEFVAVMGPSGCGKSTLLHLAGALEDPSAGRVLVGGRDLADLDIRGHAALRRSEVGYVFQRLNLLASLTAVENVALPLELDGISARIARARAKDALASVGLDEPIGIPTISPVASSSASRSPAPSSANASCCWPTSQPDHSTPPPATASSKCWPHCPSDTAPRWCW